MVNNQFLFAVAIGILLLSIGFFIWAMQQPSSGVLAPVNGESGSSGKVMVNVVNPSPQPSGNSSPTAASSPSASA